MCVTLRKPEHTNTCVSFLMFSLELESDQSLVSFPSLKDELKDVHENFQRELFINECLKTRNMGRNSLVYQINALLNEKYER